MKIAVPSTRPDLTGRVEPKLGMAAWIVVVDTEDMSFEAVQGPPRSSGPGAGVVAISLAVNLGAEVLLLGYVAQHIAAPLEKRGIKVVSGVSGSVKDAVVAYLGTPAEDVESEEVDAAKISVWQDEWKEALRKGVRQFQTLLPRLVGVVLLLGLFRGFVSKQTLLALFSGTAVFDSLWGGVLGSLLAGNPVNSYVIGDGLLDAGVGMAAVTALMLAWVNVGIIQLPAESAALGRRFAVVRNLAGFVMAVLMSLTVLFWKGGGL